MSRTTATLLALSFVLAGPAAAQSALELELSAGFTLVDIEGVAFEDGAIAEDWSQPSFRASGRALFGPDSGLRFGAELGYQSLYWYSVRIPFGSTPIRRDYSVTALSAMGIVRRAFGSTVMDAGAGLAFLDDPTPLVSVALGWEIMDRLAVKVRADGMMASEPTLPIGLGISYSLQGPEPR